MHPRHFEAHQTNYLAPHQLELGCHKNMDNRERQKEFMNETDRIERERQRDMGSDLSQNGYTLARERADPPLLGLRPVAGSRQSTSLSASWTSQIQRGDSRERGGGLRTRNEELLIRGGRAERATGDTHVLGGVSSTRAPKTLGPPELLLTRGEGICVASPLPGTEMRLKSVANCERIQGGLCSQGRTPGGLHVGQNIQGVGHCHATAVRGPLVQACFCLPKEICMGSAKSHHKRARG